MISIVPNTDGFTIHVYGDSVDNFKTILARACNVWPDAPVEVKELHDLIIHGHLLQKYEKSNFKRREELSPGENMKLDSWASENGEAGN